MQIHADQQRLSAETVDYAACISNLISFLAAPIQSLYRVRSSVSVGACIDPRAWVHGYNSHLMVFLRSQFLVFSEHCHDGMKSIDPMTTTKVSDQC